MLFVFVFHSDNNFLAKIVFSSLLLKLSLSVFLRSFLIFALVKFHLYYLLISYKKPTCV